MTPSAPVPEDCTLNYRATDEAGLSSAVTTVAISKSEQIFADGFESGGTSLWSEVGS